MGFFAFCSFLLFLSGLAGAHFYFFSAQLGLALAAFSLVLLLVLFFATLLRRRRRYTSPFVMMGGIMALALCGGLGFLAYQNPFYDYATDTKPPPEFRYPAYPFAVGTGAELLPMDQRLPRPFNAEQSAEQVARFPSLATKPIAAAPTNVYRVAMPTVSEFCASCRLVLETPANNHAEWEMQDPYLHVPVDLVLEVRAEAGDKASRIALRARSRIPFPDFGWNGLVLSNLLSRIDMSTSSLARKMAESAPKEAPIPAPVAPAPIGTKTATKPAAAKPLVQAPPPKPAVKSEGKAK